MNKKILAEYNTRIQRKRNELQELNEQGAEHIEVLKAIESSVDKVLSGRSVKKDVIEEKRDSLDEVLSNVTLADPQNKEKLETVDIHDVEILAVGTWQGNKTVTIKKTDIALFVASFDELTGNKKLNYEPPVKLGHDDDQALLQADGYPSAGWISSLKEKGEKLVASFKQVPKKLAEIIKAGGYKKVSAEFYQNYEIGGKKYPWVLKAVSLLGADVPAVKSIADIAAQYTEALLDERGVAFEVAVYDLAEGDSLTKRLRAIQDAYYQQAHNPLMPSAAGWVSEVFTDYVIVEKEGKCYQIPFTEEDGGDITFALDKAEEVVKETKYVKATEAPEALVENNQNSEMEVVMEKELRNILALDEKADVLAAVKALKAQVGKKEPVVSLAEHQATEAKVTALAGKLAERDRDDRVAKAINSGKLTPAQKPWADEYAMTNPSGFDAFITAQPVVVVLGEKGVEGGAPEAIDLTEAEIEVGAAMGVSKEALLAAKKAAQPGK